jgi:protein-S-isoprenylcysteine O-methyltransferase Ste14
MNKTLEDRLGQFLMLMIFGYMASKQIGYMYILFIHADKFSAWPLAVISQACDMIFLGLVLYFTAMRLPARDAAAGPMPRIVAIAGTFAMLLLLILPPQPIGPAMRLISTVIIIAGTLMSAWCLSHLGRSFSMVATARELKTTGSYSIVRHPLYAAETVMILGVILSHGSALAFGVGAVWLLLQVRRAQYEEAILRQTFPEYEDYARRVPMLIPGLRLSFLEDSVGKPASVTK